MQRCKSFAALVALILIFGCVPSLQPLYTEEDLVFEPALVGLWNDGDGRWDFRKSGEKQYRLVYTDSKGKKGEFIAHLLKADGHWFLDLFPEGAEWERNDFYKGHLLPVHTFFHVKQIEPALEMRTLNPEAVAKLLEKHPEAIRHEKVEDRIVLTAQPKELQAFLIKHLETKDVFGDFMNMKREKAEERGTKE